MKNPESRKTALVYIAINIPALVAAFIFFQQSLIFVAILCAAFDLLGYFTARARYKRIAALSGEINKALHGLESFDFSDFSEGELSILQSELEKMTVRMREQADDLKKDKLFLSDFLADISHQIKTPLTSINLAVSMLSQSDISDTRKMELTQDIFRSIERLEWLVSTLLKMSRLDAGTISFRTQRCSLSDVCRKASEPLLIPMELRGQELKMNIDDSAHFYGDFSWMVEAIGNILKNCTEHTSEGGSISISGTENALYSEVIISDTGHGFKPEEIPHLFERFYKGSNSGDNNVGIGLALSRMIIVNQGGTIKAENAPSGGARFIIKLYSKENRPL
jgi:signal transduction histidine kinase